MISKIDGMFYLNRSVQTQQTTIWYFSYFPQKNGLWQIGVFLLVLCDQWAFSENFENYMRVINWPKPANLTIICSCCCILLLSLIFCRRQTAEERELERQAANRLLLSLSPDAAQRKSMIFSPDRVTCLSQLQQWQENRNSDNWCNIYDFKNTQGQRYS